MSSDERSTILIVDDKDANLLALEAVLEPLQQRLVKARSGREALRFLLQDEEPAVILLDVNMPELDGFETAALIRERERTRYTPIIFVTAVRREEEHIIKGYANGAVDYVVKPFAAETMIAKVHFFLELHQRERALVREAQRQREERDEFERREQRARAEADAHREHLYALFRKAPVAIAIFQDRELRFVLANPKFEELVEKSNLVGLPGREAIPEPEAQATWDVIETVQRSHDPFLGNEYPSLWGKSSAGEQRYFNFVAQPTKGAGGELDSVMVHAVEVTDSVLARRKTEELAKQLLHTDRSKDEFLAVLGHELRNPLAPILTALHLMRLRASDTSTERERAVIERQVAHLSRLVDDLLDVSRATMGKIDLRRERLDVATAVARATEIARPMIDARKHQLAVSVPVGALYVEGDVVRLAQVIANLLQNAAKYTDVGGHIEVEARREDGQVVISVRDDGRGIRPDRLASMFELFVQGDQPSDRSDGGLGIGLTIVRSLVQLHGGTVHARSEGPGRGSEFIIRLPWQPEDAETEAPPPPEASVRTRRSRVLIVDDDAAEAEVLAGILRRAGLEVRQEHDGTSAVVAAAQFQPDVVLLDLALSGMGAIEVARRLRGDAYRTGVRLVALTTLNQPVEPRRIAAVGIENYLVKPVSPAALLEAIGLSAVAAAAAAHNP